MRARWSRRRSCGAGRRRSRLLQLDDFILWVTIGIIVGGRTGYVLFYNPAFFIQHPADIFQLWNGGMSFHGGFLGCVAAVMLFARKNDISILSLGDITTAVGPIGIFLGRLANFINSELWGRPADSSVPWAMVFPDGGPLFRGTPASSTKPRSRASCCLRSWRS